MNFLLEFTLISYASVVFFTIGLGFASSLNSKLKVVKLTMIFAIMAFSLTISMSARPLNDRIMVSLVWTSILASGYRFGRKTIMKKADNGSS